MTTECTAGTLQFQAVARRTVQARFDGGALTSDGGAVLLREVDRATGILVQFAACFRDYRDPGRITHAVAALVRQRVYGLALGYEDLNDHERLRHDPLFAVLAEAADLTAPLAGKSTLNRLELSAATVEDAERYKKIAVDHAAVDRMLVAVFLQAHPPRSYSIWMPRTIRSMARRRVASFMVTTGTTAICRSTSLRASICCAPDCGRRTSTRVRGP